MAINAANEKENFNSKFSCQQDAAGLYGTASNWVCCGLMANGERQCAQDQLWSKTGTNKYRLCKNDWRDALLPEFGGNPRADDMTYDLCCDSNQVNDCGVCSSFMVWPDISSVETFDDNWRDTFKSQSDDDRDAYENRVFPVGFVHGVLKEFNDPPICVYIPEASGKNIEIKVEPDDGGNTLCIGDLKDDQQGRNDPGQLTTCDSAKLRTCFPDGDVSDLDGFAFYINCVEGCEEGGDVNVWLRARHSDRGWTDGTTTDNSGTIEMWCDSVLDSDAGQSYDRYPSDLAPINTSVAPSIDDSSSHLTLFFITIVVALLML